MGISNSCIRHSQDVFSSRVMGGSSEPEVRLTTRAARLIESYKNRSSSGDEEQIESSWMYSSLSLTSEETVAETVAAEHNRKQFETLQSDPTWGSFFRSFDEGELVMGKKIAEGGQAQIFEVDWRISQADRAKRSTLEEQIEVSKAHWTQLLPEDEDEETAELKREEAEAAKVRNREVFKELQEKSKWGKSFFYDFEEGELVIAEKFAEGGQAEVYHAKIKWKNLNPLMVRGKDVLQDGNEYVLKVFKRTSLEQLVKTMPQAVFEFSAGRVEEWMTRRYNCDVVCGTLLKDGSFAFVLQREETDLCTLIERHMKLQSGKKEVHGPFPKEVAENFMFEIACGMKWLHDHDIVHRDIKASNVLVRESHWNNCFVADYECSVGTIGTGFWRAPEILEALKSDKKNASKRLGLFTKAADVYGYGMTCYEILTGKCPFEGHPLTDYDLVLTQKQQPTVPEHVESWVCELLTSCWQFQPKDRPSFADILDKLRENSGAIQRHENRAYSKASEWTVPKTERIPMAELKRIVSHRRKQQSQHPKLPKDQVTWRAQFDNEYELRIQVECEWVLKVFNRGSLLEELRAQFPDGLLELHADRSERAKSGPSPEWEKPRYISDVLCGTLMEDGRFAFVLQREQEDLRRLMDRRIGTEEIYSGPLFPVEVAERMMHHVACGMDWLHSYNIVHNDMKAANVLVSKDASGNYQCFVCDYECSVGVTGTGFWRAPEILGALKDRIRYEKVLELTSKASDVYSYGMTCYEILTGRLPFEEYKFHEGRDLILEGQRPEVPGYVDGWARELLNRCWQSDPEARPSFWQIIKFLETPKEDRTERLGVILDEARS